MKVLCTYCESEGASALLYEKEPLDDPVITHGICDRHYRELLAEIQAALGQGPPPEGDRLSQLSTPLPVTCKAPQFPGTELRGNIQSLGPQGVVADLPLTVAPGSRVTLTLQTWKKTYETQATVVRTNSTGGRIHHSIAFLAPPEPGFLRALRSGESCDLRAA